MNNQYELQNLARIEIEKMTKKITLLLNKYYHKPFVLESRIKDINKLRMQQELYSKRYGYNVSLDELPDIVGFRISVENDSEVIFLGSIIKNFLEPNRFVDYFSNPKESGFKALIYYFKENNINVEIQVMTIEKMYFTNATQKKHDEIKYAKILKKSII